MKATYKVLAHLITLDVILQAASIAFGIFGLAHDVDNGKVITEDYDGNFGLAWHGMSGMMFIPALTLLLFIVSFFAHIPGGVKWAAFVLLAVVLQIVLAFVGFGVPAVGALHGINALVIIGLAETAARRANVAERAPAVAAV